MTTVSAIIPAAGKGERFGNESGKIFIPIAGRPLLAHTLSAFQSCPDITEIILVARKADIRSAEALGQSIPKLKAIVEGGNERTESVRLGLEQVSGDYVAVHDGARPTVTPDLITRTIETAKEHGTAVAAVPVIDTIKETGEHDFVLRTLDRSRLWQIQTPQTFHTDLLRRAYQSAKDYGITATDDAALVERLGVPVKLVMGAYGNIKVTTPQDLELLEARLNPGMETRIGQGIDYHRTAPDRRLVLGGVEFYEEPGLDGHSDADVILHAIADALLGAAALGDIGRHFPDTDPNFKDVSSLVLLASVNRLITEQGWQVVNVDATLIADKPKIARRAHEMAEKIARVLLTDPSAINIKATTTEGIGEIGSGEAMSCQAVACITRKGSA